PFPLEHRPTQAVVQLAVAAPEDRRQPAESRPDPAAERPADVDDAAQRPGGHAFERLDLTEREADQFDPLPRRGLLGDDLFAAGLALLDELALESGLEDGLFAASGRLGVLKTLTVGVSAQCP